MKTKPKVLLADDEDWQASRFIEQLELIRGIHFLGWVGDYHELLEEVRKTRPDLLILDLHVDGLPDPRMTVVLELIPRLKRDYPRMKILAITNMSELIGLAQEAGADDVRRKYAVAQVALWKQAISRLVHLVDKDPDRLTDMEIRTLRLVGEGKNNKEIAEEEHVTVYAVKARLKTIFQKLKVKNRTQAVRVGRKNGYDV